MKMILILLSLLISFECACPVSITWDFAPADQQVQQYKIYRLKGSEPQLVGSVNSATHTFSLDSVLTGSRNTFYVTAVNVQGESQSSDKVTIQKH